MTGSIITGGSSGIGAALVHRFALRGPVADFSRSTGVDVSDPLRVGDAFDNLDFDPTVLIANAGIIEVEPFLEANLDRWMDVIDVNLTGTFIVAQRFARLLAVNNRSGTIGLVSSTASRGPRPRYAAYAASKAGMVSLGETMAEALRPHSIRVLTFVVGAANTPLRRQIAPGEDPAESMSPDYVASEIDHLVWESQLSGVVEIRQR